MKQLLIYGGTFDPPHLGHIETACAVQAKFSFDQFLFVPCKLPVLKAQNVASPKQRFEMLKLALLPYPQFKIDTRELDRDTPSFMVDTLKSFHREYKNNISVTLLLGMDAFLELPRWHQWEQIMMLCDLIVMQRAGDHNNKIPEALQAKLNASSCMVTFFEAGNYPIASSTVRSMLQAGETLETNLLPEAVYNYIRTHQLYQAPPQVQTHLSSP